MLNKLPKKQIRCYFVCFIHLVNIYFLIFVNIFFKCFFICFCNILFVYVFCNICNFFIYLQTRRNKRTRKRARTLRQLLPQTLPVPVSHSISTEEEDTLSPSQNSEEKICASTDDHHESDDLVCLNEEPISYEIQLEESEIQFEIVDDSFESLDSTLPWNTEDGDPRQVIIFD